MAKKNPKKRTPDQVYRDCKAKSALQKSKSEKNYKPNWVGLAIAIATLSALAFVFTMITISLWP